MRKREIFLGAMIYMACMALLIGCKDVQRKGVGDVSQKTKFQLDTVWNSVLLEKLPLLGHRNWILVVDKAYPAPAGTNIQVIHTHRPMLEVLDTVVGTLARQPHVRPIFYVDKEAEYLDESLAPGIEKYRAQLAERIAGAGLQPANHPGDHPDGKLPARAQKVEWRSLWHDDVFQKMDKASELFQVIVLKTESLIPYSSVFMELDCKYWDATREQALRKKVASQ